jgi:hypothetical protein
MVYLREDKAGEKVVEFLSKHLFGPDRIEALKESLICRRSIVSLLPASTLLRRH